MKIIKRKDDDSKATEIQLEIPLNIHLIGERGFDECAEIALNEINNKTSIIFEHLECLTLLAENEDVRITHFLDVVYAVTAFGKGLVEASANIEMARHQQRNKPQAHEKPLDVTGFKQLRGLR